MSARASGAVPGERGGVGWEGVMEEEQGGSSQDMELRHGVCRWVDI